MSRNTILPPEHYQSMIADDEIDLRELFGVIWRGKWIIIVVAFVFAAASVLYALNLPNIYKSEALLAPVTEQKSSGLSGQLSGLVALVGGNIGGANGGTDNAVLAMEILKSREFLSRFIQKHKLLPEIMAVKGWVQDGNQLIYNDKVYDFENKIWIRQVEPHRKPEPSLQEAYEAFQKIFSVSQDKTTNMVRVSVEHVSPQIAKQWVEQLVAEINNEMKQRDIREARLSIKYLEEQIATTKLVDLRATFFSLINEQTKTLMLANVREEYVFKTVDPAIVPEEKAKPRRSLIVLVATFAGGFLAVLFVLLRNMFTNNKN